MAKKKRKMCCKQAARPPTMTGHRRRTLLRILAELEAHGRLPRFNPNREIDSIEVRPPYFGGD